MAEDVGSDDEYDLDENGFYETVKIEDMEFDKVEKVYRYPCPCGDQFCISEVNWLIFC